MQHLTDVGIPPNKISFFLFHDTVIKTLRTKVFIQNYLKIEFGTISFETFLQAESSIITITLFPLPPCMFLIIMSFSISLLLFHLKFLPHSTSES